MKIKSGFISNSSTTSFAAYGCKIDYEELDELFKDDVDFKEYIEDVEKNSSNLYHDKYEYINKFFEKKSNKNSVLEYVNSYEGEIIYIGRPLKSIGDDETGKEFKLSTGEMIKNSLGIDNLKFGYIIEEINC